MMGQSDLHSTGSSPSQHNPPRRRRPSTWRVWAMATRPHTLTASVCPCLVAYASLPRSSPSAGYLWMVWLLFCSSVQIGTNLHNDYSDFVQGADDPKTRVGQPRATAQGWLTPMQTCVAATGTLSVTLVCGIVLIGMTQQWTNSLAWFLILSSVFNAFAYTAGPYPLGYIGLERCSIAYSGLGDIFVFVYFGLVATWMLPYLLYCQNCPSNPAATSPKEMIHSFSPLALSTIVISGIQVGLLATNIIVVNNLRDRHTDAFVGKNTTAVRFGRTFGDMEYVTCNAIVYALVVFNAWLCSNKLLHLLPLLSLPMAIQETKSVLSKEAGDLNEHVGGTARVQLAFCVLLAASLLLR